jgi:hypothetical protein
MNFVSTLKSISYTVILLCSLTVPIVGMEKKPTESASIIAATDPERFAQLLGLIQKSEEPEALLPDMQHSTDGFVRTSPVYPRSGVYQDTDFGLAPNFAGTIPPANPILPHTFAGSHPTSASSPHHLARLPKDPIIENVD